MTTMVTLTPHTYDGKQREVGDEYDAEPRFVQVLVHMGRSKVKDEEQYKTRDMVSQTTASPEATQYNTRSNFRSRRRNQPN